MSIPAAIALLLASGICQVTTWRTDGDHLLRVVVCAVVTDPAAPQDKPEPEGDPA